MVHDHAHYDCFVHVKSTEWARSWIKQELNNVVFAEQNLESLGMGLGMLPAGCPSVSSRKGKTRAWVACSSSFVCRGRFRLAVQSLKASGELRFHRQAIEATAQPARTARLKPKT